MDPESDLLKAVEAKLQEKDEVIYEQQRQLVELEAELERLRGGADGGGAPNEGEKDLLIKEQMRQITELQEKLQSGGGGGSEDQEELIREQMTQILELSEQVERLESRLAELSE